MRSLMVVVGALCAFGLGQHAAGQEAKDFRASEGRIFECLTAADKQRRPDVDTRRLCIGQETQRCWDSAEGDLRALKEFFCVSAEVVAWSAILDRTYASLRQRVAKVDEEFAKLTMFDPPLVAALPLLATAHEAWLAGSVDCEVAAALVGPGTDRNVQPARCSRDRIAERALLYRQGLMY